MRAAPIPLIEFDDDEFVILINALGTDPASDKLRKKLISLHNRRVFKYARTEDVMKAHKRTLKKFGPMFKRLANNGD